MRAFVVAMLTLIVIVELVLRTALAVVLTAITFGVGLLVLAEAPEILTPAVLPFLKEYAAATNTPQGGANGLR